MRGWAWVGGAHGSRIARSEVKFLVMKEFLILDLRFWICELEFGGTLEVVMCGTGLL